MKKNILKLFLIFFLLFFLTSCSCSCFNCGCTTHYMSLGECEEKIKSEITLENDKRDDRKNQTLNYIKSVCIMYRGEYINTFINGSVTETFDLNSLDLLTIEKISNQASILLSDEFESLSAKEKKTGIDSEAEKTFIDSKVNDVKSLSLIKKIKETATETVSNVADDSEYSDYIQHLFNEARIKAVTSINEVSDEIQLENPTEDSYDEELLKRANVILSSIQTLQKEVQSASTNPGPIRFELNSVGDFFSNFFDNFFIYPVGWLLQFFTKLCGNMYIFGLLITTLLIRTVAWPIYAKSNDMTLKMKIMEPEQARIQEKYARRKDPESQKMMQMEMMQLYKKYGVGIGGCIMPFIQLPIFLAVFRAVSKLPYTNGAIPGIPDWANGMNSKVFGVDLFLDKSTGGYQLLGIIILCVLVGVTQVLQQVLMELRNKKQQREAQADIPEYRRKAVQQSQTQGSMKVFMWVMVIMMVVFVFTSAAGLGVYWLIGNCYALLQSYIGSKNTEKRMEKLRKKI